MFVFVESYAFDSCTSLEDVTIPESVTLMDYKTFEKCTALKTVTIKSTSLSIGSYTFEGCSSLQSITYYGSTEPEYGISIFYGCNVFKNVYVPITYTNSTTTFCGTQVTVTKKELSL